MQETPVRVLGREDPLEIMPVFLGSPAGSASKRIHPQYRRPGFDPWVGRIPWRRERLPTPVFWPGEFQGLYSPWGCKESDTTETLTFTFMCIKMLTG